MEKSCAINFDDVKLDTIDVKRTIDVGKLRALILPSADEVRTRIEHFLQDFADQYQDSGPLAISFIGPLDEALDHSLFEPITPRPLILYLHHSRSIAVNIFSQYVLCTEAITDYLAEEFLIWTWDRTQEDNYSTLLSVSLKYTTEEVTTTVASFPSDAYPLLVCLSVHQGQIDVVSVIQGTMSNEQTLASLLETRKKFTRRSELAHSKPPQTNIVLNENQSILADVLKLFTDRSIFIEKTTKDFENSYMQIVRIDQIENTAWIPKYLEQKEIIDTRLGHDQNEQFLFHGCPSSAAEEIIQRGFDHKFIGMHGVSYGYGFYFSSDYSLSHCYTTPDHSNNNERTMLVCRVLVGRTCLGNETIKTCPAGYNSTTNASTIYVVYSNRHILPVYLITYKEKHNTYNDELVAYSNKASRASICTIC